MTKKKKVGKAVKSTARRPVLRLRQMLELLSENRELRHEQLRVATYALSVFQFSKFVHVLNRDIALALGTSDTNVSDVLTTLSETEPPLMLTKKQGRETLRRFSRIDKTVTEFAMPKKKKSKNGKSKTKG